MLIRHYTTDRHGRRLRHALPAGLQGRDRSLALTALANAGGNPLVAATRLRLQADLSFTGPVPPPAAQGFIARRLRCAMALESTLLEEEERTHDD